MSNFNDKLSEVIEILRDIRYEDSKEKGLHWKSELQWLIEDLECQYQSAVRLYDNMKEEGLAFSTIEAEGFVRGLKTALEAAKSSFDEGLSQENV